MIKIILLLLTIYKPSNSETIKCHGNKSCLGSEFFAGDGIFDNIICSGDFACANATITRNDVPLTSNHGEPGSIVCSGDNSCERTTITAIPATIVVCSRNRACLDGEWIIEAVQGKQMSINCVAEESCRGLDITVNGGAVDRIICNDDFSCRDARITINNPSQDFQVKCKARGSCQDMVLEINVPPKSIVDRFKGIKCEDIASCAGAEITVANQGKNDIIINKLSCTHSTSCRDTIFNMDAGNNTVIFNKCKCKDQRGCDDYIGCSGEAVVYDYHPSHKTKQYQIDEYFNLELNAVNIGWIIFGIFILNIFTNTVTCISLY